MPEIWYLRVGIQASWLIGLAIYEGFDNIYVIDDIQLQLPYSKTAFGEPWIEDIVEAELRETINEIVFFEKSEKSA